MRRRNVGLDLLRCIMMYAIVVHHCCCHSGVATGRLAEFLFLLTLPAVDCFAGISGWFGMRFSISKIFKLLLQIALCSASLSVLALAGFKLGLNHLYIGPGVGWFGVCYFALMLVAPFVNFCLEWVSRSKIGKAIAIVLWLVLFLTWQYIPCWGLFFVPCSGSHSVGTLALVYISMRLFGANGIYGDKAQRCVAIGLPIVLLVFLAIGIISILSGRAMLDQISGFYAAPIVMMLSFFLVSMAARLKTLWRLDALLSSIVPSLFSVYLLHDAHPFGREFLIARPLRYLDSIHFMSPDCQPLVLLLWAFVVFALCVSLDFGARKLFAVVRQELVGRIRVAK